MPARIALCVALALAGICLLTFLTARSSFGASQVGSDSDIEVFVREGCPHCAAAKRFLVELQRERPGLRILFHDVGKDPAALSRLNALAETKNVRPIGVPAFYLQGELLVGFLNEQTTGTQLRAMLDRGGHPASSNAPPGACLPQTATPCDTQPLGPPTERNSIETGLFGRLTVHALGLPLFTLAIGLLDGFNPCAMWVLLFLLSLLVHLRSRTKMAFIAGTFVLVSGLVYFAFMAAWLNVFLWVGMARSVQMLLAFVATAIGIINVKDFFTLRQGLSIGIPETAKPGLYARGRAVLQADNLLAATCGIVVLAVLVNAVELLCTAGFPALYTEILTLRRLPRWEYYGYLGLYNVAYMLDDAVMVGIAVVTLSHHQLQTGGARWLKLISGLVMIGLGSLLLVKPDWLIG
jgi:glutaredoxin